MPIGATHLTRNLRERSMRKTFVKPHEWQIDTAFEDHAVEKAIRGPTSTTVKLLSAPSK